MAGALVMGRPSKYTPAIAERICEHIATGLLLPEVCALKEMPVPSTVFLWLTKYSEFSEQYARAKDIQCEMIAAEAKRIADVPQKGKKLKRIVKDDGSESTEVLEGDMIDRARLQVDTRKWLLSKMFPKKYGDRLELAGDEKNPLVVVSVAQRIRERRAKLREGQAE